MPVRSLNNQLRKLHETTPLPVSLTYKLCVRAAILAWGGGGSDPIWIPVDHDFVDRASSELGKYKPQTIGHCGQEDTVLEHWISGGATR